jgi:acid phosphatase class B
MTKTELCERDFEFSSLSVEKPRHFCKNNVQNQKYHHSHDRFSIPKTIARPTNHSYKGDKRPF